MNVQERIYFVFNEDKYFLEMVKMQFQTTREQTAMEPYYFMLLKYCASMKP